MPSPGRPFFAHPDFDPALPADNPPAPAPEATTQQEPPAAPTAAPEPRLYAGKYKTPEELEAGYANSFKELERIQQGYEQQLAAERKRVDDLFAASRAPATPEVDPFAGLAEVGVPPDVIRAAVQAEARRIAREEVEAGTRPIREDRQRERDLSVATTRVNQRYADFAEVQQAVADGLAADPQSLATYTRMFGADPEAAMEWAYLRHRMANPASTQRVSAADEPAAGAITSQRTPEVRSAPTDAPRAEEEARGLKYLRTYGDPRFYLRARLKDVIPDSHFS